MRADPGRIAYYSAEGAPADAHHVPERSLMLASAADRGGHSGGGSARWHRDVLPEEEVQHSVLDSSVHNAELVDAVAKVVGLGSAKFEAALGEAAEWRNRRMPERGRAPLVVCGKK